MNKETRTALEESIKHWEENVERAENGEEINLGIGSCALCGRFFEGNCRGCPIKEQTGKPVCRDTPYEDVTIALENEDWDAMLDAARAELEFLKSLRPTETQPE